MKISEAVANQLSFTNDGALEFGRDSRGLFVRWDNFEVDFRTNEVKFYAGKEVVGTIVVDESIAFRGESIFFTGMEGVCRIKIG